MAALDLLHQEKTATALPQSAHDRELGFIESIPASLKPSRSSSGKRKKLPSIKNFHLEAYKKSWQRRKSVRKIFHSKSQSSYSTRPPSISIDFHSFIRAQENCPAVSHISSAKELEKRSDSPIRISGLLTVDSPVKYFPDLEVAEKCPSIPRFSWQSRRSIVDLLQLRCQSSETGLTSWAEQLIQGFDNRHQAKDSISDSANQAFHRRDASFQRPFCSSPCCHRRKPAISGLPTYFSKCRIEPLTESPTIMAESAAQSGYTSPARSENSGYVGEYASPRRGNEPPMPTSNPQLSSPSRTTGALPDGAPQNLSGLVCNVYRTTGNEPPALVGASTTIVGDKLYVFGGRRVSHRRPHLTRRFYELDLVHRHWTRLETHGRPPNARYFHSMCSLGDTKLVCYGGMAPTIPRNQDPAHRAGGANSNEPGITVMSDVHIYDIPTQTWTAITTPDAPPGRYAHCAAILPSSGVFSSATAPLSAIQHNPASSNPNQGSIGITIDGRGGAEMVIVGGQDSASKYIETICVFNLRSLRWTTSCFLGKSCGAYRSVVAPLVGISASQIGPQESRQWEAEESKSTSKTATASDENDQSMTNSSGCAMLLYSNYNFLDVKLELQVRHPDGSMQEKKMRSISQMPPGLRFPNGGLVNNHLVISGTFLTSSKQEYALWALNLKTLVWSRVDVGLASVSTSSAATGVFSSGSWNRGLVWKQRNAFVVLGNRKRNLGEDYHHRRLNFTNFCVVELEAFGLYDNPRHNAYRAMPLRSLPEPSLSAVTLGSQTQQESDKRINGLSGGAIAAEKLGLQALQMRELCDMDFLAIGGERIPVNSHMVAWRWGPFFHQLIQESNTRDREGNGGRNTSSGESRPGIPQRNSSITITPSLLTVHSSTSTLVPGIGNGIMSDTASVNTAIHTPSVTSTQSTLTANMANTVPTTATSRPHAPFFSTHPITKYSRLLYFPHTLLTLRALTHYLYTGILPPPSSQFCTPQILCSLLQIARPYQINGLLEATVQRLHEILDARNTAAVFNAAAMAAGGGEATKFYGLPLGAPHSGLGHSSRNQYNSAFAAIAENGDEDLAANTVQRSREANQPPGLAIMNMSNGSGGATRPSTAGHGGIDDSDEGFLQGALHGGGGLVSRSRHPSISRSRKVSADAAVGEAGGQEMLRSSSRSASTTSMSDSDMSGSETSQHNLAGPSSLEQEIWAGGEPSQVIGLQKRGLRGLMEGRRLRERDNAAKSASSSSLTASATATNTTTTGNGGNSRTAGGGGDAGNEEADAALP